MFTDFYESWIYLDNHPIFIEKLNVKLDDKFNEIFGIDNTEDIEYVFTSHFKECLNVEVIEVNPETMELDSDEELNTKTQIWLKTKIYRKECVDDNYNLDCGADTFEKAIVELANLVQQKYGDDYKKIMQLLKEQFEKNIRRNFKMTERKIETMLGEDLFTYEERKFIEPGEIEYYKVEFPFKSMKKYNGGKVKKYDDGALRIYKDEIWSGFVTDIPEFRDLLLKRLKKEKLTSLYNTWRDKNEHLVENFSEGSLDTDDKEIRKLFSDYAGLKEIISTEVMSELEDQYPEYSERMLEKAEDIIVKYQ